MDSGSKDGPQYLAGSGPQNEECPEPRQDEIAEYDQAIGSLLPQPIAPPPVLWHYTSGASLVAILQEAKLWSTHVSCLNDGSEYRYGLALFRDALQRLAKCGVTSDVHRLLDAALAALNMDMARVAPFFVASFSATKDDLSQWRA